MKKILKISAIFVLILLQSCDKNEIIVDLENENLTKNKNELELTESKFDIDEFRDCFNEMSTKTKKPLFEDVYGNTIATKIQYQNSKGIKEVYPLFKNGSIENLLWVNDINDGYYISKTNAFKDSDIIGTTITHGAVSLFLLEELDFEDISTISNKLGKHFNVNSNGRYILIEELEGYIPREIDDNTPPNNPISHHCNYEELADLYFIMFGFYDDSGQFADYVFDKQIMVDAIHAIVPQNDYCYCPLPCLLQATLNLEEDIPQSIKDQMNQNYVMDKFNLPLDFPIEEYPSELLADLVEIGCGRKEWDETSDWSAIYNTEDYPCPIWLEEHPEIQNGIDIGPSQVVDDCNESTTLIGESPNRGNANVPEGDLTHGFNHNNEGVIYGDGIFDGQPITDDEYFEAMEDLFWITTGCDHDMRIVTDLFIETFKTNTSINTEVSHPILTQKVIESNDFINYMKRFGLQVQEALENCEGVIEDVFIDMEGTRPQFGGAYNNFHGLTILINDTEETNIYLEDDSFTCNDDGWCVDVCVDITDHFGLDFGDVLEFQPQMNWESISDGNPGHFGFNAWWMLQHRRNYVPFKTKVNIKTTICGQF